MSALHLRRLGESLLMLAGLIGLWWAVSALDLVGRVFLPSPSAVLHALGRGFTGDGELASLTLGTLLRMVIGWGLASLLGMVLGVLIGSSTTVRTWLQPTLELVRPMPASAIVPLAIALLGLSPGMVLAVVAFGAMWPVLLATVHGLAAVHPQMHEVADVLQLGRAERVWKIGLPAAMPDILAGLRLAVTVSLVVSVVGEMLASQPGLGQAILLAARAFRADELFAGIALLGAIGLAANTLLALLERHLLRWQPHAQRA